MESKASAVLILAVFLISTTTTATAFNITRLLSQYSDFSTFNSMLSATNLAQQINSRRTITVLAIGNDAIGGLTSKPEDFVKTILSVHVILDYYDSEKLDGLSKKSTILTTLYQSTGVAADEQGFLNVTKSGGQIVFASANHQGQNSNATLVGAVASQPYNISVLQVSGPIIPSGIEAMNTSNNPFPLPPIPAITPNPAKPPRSAPAPDVPVIDGPAPSDAPAADTPADAPATVAPISSPPAPAADSEAPAPGKSSSSRVAYSIGLAVVMGAVFSLLA